MGTSAMKGLNKSSSVKFDVHVVILRAWNYFLIDFRTKDLLQVKQNK